MLSAYEVNVMKTMHCMRGQALIEWMLILGILAVGMAILLGVNFRHRIGDWYLGASVSVAAAGIKQ